MVSNSTRLRVSIHLILSVAFIFAAAYANAQEHEIYARGQLLVKIKTSSNIDLTYTKDEIQIGSQFIPFLSGSGINAIHKAYPSKSEIFSNIFRVKFDENVPTGELIEKFESLEFVEYARRVPNPVLFFDFPNDFDPQLQYGLEIIDAPAAWNIANSTEEIIIAVIDNAFNINHEDLRNNIWVNQGEMTNLPPAIYDATDTDNNNNITSKEIYEYLLQTGTDYNNDGEINLTDALSTASPFSNAADDEGNGYTDDIFGWDAAFDDNNPNPEYFDDYSYNHGTHVAGIAGALSNNGTGIASLAYNVKILPVKAAQTGSISLPYGDNGMVYISDVNTYCEQVDVVNMSWGGSSNVDDYALYLNELHNQGTVLVAACGNNGSTYSVYPAYNEFVIAVGATDAADEACSFSNRHDSVDVMAPGDEIYSCWPGSESSYGKLSGTSMSSPLVASLCGLVLACNNTLSPEEVEYCLDAGCETEFNWYTNPTSNYYGLSGAGRVNAFNSVICATNLSGAIANFSGTPDQSTCLSILLTDQSLNANYWKWDFGNDGTVDATSQSTSWMVPDYGVYEVKLEVSDNGIGWHTFVRTVEVSQPVMSINAQSAYHADINYASYAYLSFTGTPPWRFEYSINGTSQGPVETSDNPYELTCIFDNVGSKELQIDFLGDAVCNTQYSDTLSFLVFDTLECSGEYNHWAFSSYKGIDFNSGTPVAYTTNISCGEGSSTISDVYGNLLLYSSGEKIWNRNHQIMLNGNLQINCGSITNTSLILENPGDATQFYVFSLSSQWHTSPNILYYSIVDMDGDNGLGEVIQGPTELFATDILDEKMGLARHQNGKDAWLLVHGSKTASNYSLRQSFLAFLITGSGIAAPVITQIGPTDNIHGGMKFSRNGKKVVWYLTGNACMYDFDKANGTLSNEIRLSGSESGDYAGFGAYAYGIEFSPDNSKLYISGFMSYDKLMQYDITLADETAINASRKVIENDGFGTLQIGPDNRIYTGFGYVIPNPNEAYPDCGFVEIGLPSTFISLPAPVLQVGCYSIIDNTKEDLVQFSESQLMLYPNPNSGEFSFDINKPKNETFTDIEVCNILGDIVYSDRLYHNSKEGTIHSEINIQGQPNGIYILKASNGNEVLTRKFIVE